VLNALGARYRANAYQQGQAIANHFQHAGDTSWITAAITILTVVLGPIISHAADYWGRKWFLTVLTAVGAVGGAVVARASSMAMAIAGFAFIGIAFGVQPLLHTVASEVLPRRWRAWAQACVMTSNALGLGAGLVVGGAINHHENPDGFRSYFLAAMGLFAVASATCFLAYQPLPTTLQATHTFNEKITELDWIGYLLLSGSLVCFCTGLSWSQNPYPWSDPHTVAPFIVGIVLGSVLILYEARFKKDGMFHHGLFKKNNNFPIVLICVFCEGMAFFAYNVYFAFQVSTRLLRVAISNCILGQHVIRDRSPNRRCPIECRLDGHYSVLALYRTILQQ
jgi:MFS family permease